ncbi:hypothetical protein P7C70_g4952, partial [Phenoliferia sp. Uapishka_3]
MPKLPSTRSTFNSRVSIYEPPTQASTSTAAAPASSSIASTSRRPTRSSPFPTPATAATPEKQPRIKASASPSPRKPTPFKVALDKAHPAPNRWEEAYEIIRQQREGIVAPVDTMGCEQGGRDRIPAAPVPDPVGPRCDLCDVAKVPRLCPSKKAVVVRSPRKVKAEEEGKPKVEVGIEGDVKMEGKEEGVGEVRVEGGTKIEEMGGEVKEESEVKAEVKVENLGW